MNAFLWLDGIELWHVMGWTMLHFLWLGALAGLVAGACLLMLRRAPANVRYLAALACLALLAALPVGVAAWVVAKPQAEIVAVSSDFPINQVPAGEEFEIIARNSTIINEPVELSGATDSAKSSPAPRAIATNSSGALPLAVFALDSCARYLPWLWLIGTPLTFTLLATGIIGAERLRHASRTIADGPIAETCARLLQALRIGRRVTVAVCERIAAPVLVGIVRPIILLPPAALTGWSPDEIEMVLLHELAHVRRWDNLINLAQRIIESLLFFHPAVWLVSSWVRREREACCDAVVVRRTNRPHAYAEMLVALAAQMPRSDFIRGRGRPGSLAATSAMAAAPLRGRIRRILQLEDDPMLISGKSLALAMSGLLLAATLVVLNLPTRGQAEESTTEVAEENSVDQGWDVRSEVELVKSLFTAGKQNPLQTRYYQVPPSLKRALSLAFEGLMRDPYGPKVKFESRWNSNRSAFEITAPKNAHEAFFNVCIQAVAAESKRRAAAASDVDGFAEESTTNVAAAGGVTGIRWLGIGGSLPVDVTDQEGQRIVRELLKNPAVQTAKINRTPEGRQSLFVSIKETAGKRAFLSWNTESEGRLTCSLKFIELPSELPSRDQAEESAAESTETQRSDKDVRRLSVAISDHQTATAESEPGRLRLQIRETKGSSDKFPSLEDQKLADLAWKRLGLELEPIGADDLKRVKALGYDGGVMVSGTNRPEGGLLNIYKINGGDILVGLHVWPTTSLKDVADVLNRDDLAELNPLKFYVIRYENTGDDDKDTVITGRISMNLPNRPTSQSPLTKPRPPVAAGPADRYSAPQPQPAIPGAAKQPTLRYDGKTFDQWRTAWQTELSTEKRLEAVKALAAFGANGYGKEAAETILELVGQYDWMVIGDNRGIVPLQNACVTAFGGSAVVGKEGVVAQHLPQQVALPIVLDAVKSDNRQVKLFLRWVLTSFDDPRAIDALLELSRDSDSQVSFSAVNALPAIDAKNPNKKLVDRIREGLGGDSTDAEAFIRKLTPGWYGPPGTRQPGKYLYYLPELYPKLFSKHERVRRQARQVLRWIGPTDASTVIEQLMKVLHDDSRSDERVEAIRALAVLGPRAKPAAVESLTAILAGDSDVNRVAAAAALLSILGPKEYGSLLTQTIGEELGVAVNPEGGMVIKDDRYDEFERRVTEESNSLTQ